MCISLYIIASASYLRGNTSTSNPNASHEQDCKEPKHFFISKEYKRRKKKNAKRSPDVCSLPAANASRNKTKKANSFPLINDQPPQ
jgi:hypothetical protein